MKADFTGSVKPGSELATPLTDDIACLGLIGSVLTSRIQDAGTKSLHPPSLEWHQAGNITSTFIDHVHENLTG